MNYSERFFGFDWSGFSGMEKLSLLFLAITPCLYLGVNHWITNMSVIAAICILFCTLQNVNNDDVTLSLISPWVKLIFFVYVIAIFVSQLGRNKFDLEEYLDQSRWIFGYLFFIFLLNKKVDYTKILDWVLPVCLVVAWVSSTFSPSLSWGHERVTVKHLDPLAFGTISLGISLMCFASAMVDIGDKKIRWCTVIHLLACGLGFYLSIRSGSRSGWFAVPIVLLLMLSKMMGPGIRKKIGIIILVSLLCFIFFVTSETVRERIDQLIAEIIDYPWSGGVAQDTSVGLRITFYRLGFFYFSENPLFGWGERGYLAIKDAPELMAYSTQFARDFAYGALFHSEWTTQAVRFGVFGFSAVVIVFFIPLRVFWKDYANNVSMSRSSAMGLSYVLCLLVASLGNEVFNSKGMITLAALFYAGLLATVLRKIVAPKDSG